MLQKPPRCLLFYPWYLDQSSGALSVFLAYCRALKNAGFLLDCFAPCKSPFFYRQSQLACDLFDNIFHPPSLDTPLTGILRIASQQYIDRGLPDRGGCNDAAMISSGILAAISDYSLVGVHYTRCHTISSMLPFGVPRILFTHDLDAQVVAQEAMVWARPNPSYTLVDEISRFKSFDIITVLGHDDLHSIKALAPSLPVLEAPLVLELKPSRKMKSSAKTLLWISSLSNFHRISFEWFWQHVWKTVRSAHPDCRLIVAGDICQCARLLGASLDSQVVLEGFVDSLDAIYDQADIAVAPYYYGAGVKVKVLEALARGVPVVTTSYGLSNTRLVPGRDLLSADDALSYARCLTDLMSAPERIQALRDAGLDYIRKHHNPDSALHPFIEAALALVNNPRSSSVMAVHPDVEAGLKILVPWVIHHCRTSGFHRIAIFGAGSHTRALLTEWKAAGGCEIISILTSFPTPVTEIGGLPVMHIHDFAPHTVDALVLSSCDFEGEMAELCYQHWPRLPAVPIWHPLSVLQSRQDAHVSQLQVARKWNQQIPIIHYAQD